MEAPKPLPVGLQACSVCRKDAGPRKGSGEELPCPVLGLVSQAGGRTANSFPAGTMTTGKVRGLLGQGAEKLLL